MDSNSSDSPRASPETVPIEDEDTVPDDDGCFASLRTRAASWCDGIVWLIVAFWLRVLVLFHKLVRKSHAEGDASVDASLHVQKRD
jgi:hypothetical protein